ncbi:MAG: hypothetical protein ACJAW8_001458 [Oleispira sp.]|mgnify:CR=1 FL=1|jgi:hypothetical protein
MTNIIESKSDGKTVGNDESNVSKYFRVFNPVFLSLVLILFIILIFRDAFLLPYMELVLRLVIPTMYECNNLGGGIGIFFGCVSYFLALLVLIFYSVALNCESNKQYVVGSILGVISTGAWFFWGAIIFVLCGIRAH